MRFLSGRGISLSHTFLEDEDVISVPSVSVTVWGENATTETFTGPASLNGDAWEVTLPKLSQGAYRVVWDGNGTVEDETRFEVVGGFLFSIPEARGSDEELADNALYPAAELRGYRDVVETEFETITGRSFTPRSAVVDFVADGSDTYWLGLFDCYALTALETVPENPDSPLTVTDYHLDGNGLLSGLEGFCEGTRLRATVDYGFRATPEDVKRAGFIRLRFLLAAEDSGVPDRATSFVAAEGGQFTLATPGRNGYKTGVPEVDAVLSLYSYDVVRDVMGVG